MLVEPRMVGVDAMTGAMVLLMCFHVAQRRVRARGLAGPERGRLLAMASWLLLVGFGVPIGVVVLLDFLARRGR
ncbi:hypothetical protein MFUL124B02_41885 [Myxococcus fulvus 124B02]|nr:hypothetical protein MFUL124B02_41885 [Myxococcus fulvus 124B02]